jgi:hypothetical protein
MPVRPEILKEDGFQFNHFPLRLSAHRPALVPPYLVAGLVRLDPKSLAAFSQPLCSASQPRVLFLGREVPGLGFHRNSYHRLHMRAIHLGCVPAW